MFGGKKDDRVETPDWTPSPAPVREREQHKSEPIGDSRTAIGAGTTIKGEVSVKGDVAVYGTIEGALNATGSVEVMKGGMVKADVTGKSVKVTGRVEGRIVSGDRVQLVSGAYVKGDIHSQSLKIDEGVFFQGACVMGENPLDSARVIPMPEPVVKVHQAANG
jgi:cytoskeletal protein CcmA (bactofilin family)